jgi:hypothetical protein
VLRFNLSVETAGQLQWLCDALDTLRTFARGTGSRAVVRKRLAAMSNKELMQLWSAAGRVVEAFRGPLERAPVEVVVTVENNGPAGERGCGHEAEDHR